MSVFLYFLLITTTGKEKLEQLPCEQFLQGFEILSGKQVSEKRDFKTP